jgi:hypothetical protein
MWVCKNLEPAVDALNALIPLDGPCVNPVKNRKLDQFRKAQNVVHDIFNNGLGNRGKSLKCMGLQKHDLMLPFSQGDYHHPGDFDQIERVITPIMEQKIYDACAEQNITLKVKETI